MTMRKLSILIPSFLVGLAGLLLAPPAARAQNVGALVGHVYDQSGLPLRGVVVTLTSDTQIGGARTGTTDDEGAFRFQGLFPGKFKVTASAPKLRTVVQENVRVTQNSTVDIDIVMEVETAQEEVRIVEKAPVINLRSTTVGESFDEEFLNTLPLASRTYQGVAALAPGVSDRDGDGNPNSRGGAFFSNKYTVDGFNTTDPVTRTFGQNFSFNAMANVEVTTASFGAENSDTAGMVTNIVTKSGSNRFELDVGAEYSDHHLRLFKDSRDRGTSRGMSGHINASGPIRKDRLWYYLSAEAWQGVSSLDYDPNFPSHPPSNAYGLDGIAKLTWRLTPRNTIALRGTLSPAAFNNQLQNPLVEPEAEARQFQRSEFLGLSWESLITDELFLVGRASYRQQRFDVGPQSCEWDPANCTQIPAEFDILTGFLRRNYNSQQIDHRKTIELSGRLEYLKDSRTLGGHQVRLDWLFELMGNDIRETVPGDTILTNLGSAPFSRTTFCSNDPKLENGICRTNFLRSTVTGDHLRVSLSDAWKPTRYLTISPGVAFHRGNSENDRGVKVTNMNAVTPHLSLIWDATHDGKTKLFGSVGGIADTGFLALARFTSRSLYSRRCGWDTQAQAYVASCRSEGGNDSTTVGLPCGPEGFSPDGSPCRSKLSPPRTWEYTAGAEREILPGIGLGGVFVYRKFDRQWEDVETNANWNEGGTGLRREAPFKTGRSEFIFDLQTPVEANRRHRAITAYLRKREGRLKVNANYTWTDYQGASDSSFAGAFLDNPGDTKYYYGPLGGDVRHDLRLQGTFQFLTWLSAGLVYKFESGPPYNRFFFDPVYQRYTRLQAQRGKDSQGNLNPDDDTPLRLPDSSTFDLKVLANLEPLIKKRLSVWVDALNLLALRTPLGVIQQDGPFWGRPAAYRAPLRVVLGARYLY
jgi:hypothetical protein